MKASDVINFSTEYPRLNIFQRQQLSVYFNETGKGRYLFDEHRGRLSEAAYGLELLT